MSEEVTNVLLPLETCNKVLQYLSSRPYAEVAELITEFQSKANVVEPKPEQVLESDGE